MIKEKIDRVAKKIDPDACTIDEWTEFYGQNFNEVGLPDFSEIIKKTVTVGKGVIKLVICPFCRADK